MSESEKMATEEEIMSRPGDPGPQEQPESAESATAVAQRKIIHDLTVNCAKLKADNEELQRIIAELCAEVREWLCVRCHTVYSAPLYNGVNCVICPKCQTATLGPRASMEIRQLRRCVKETMRALERILS